MDDDEVIVSNFSFTYFAGLLVLCCAFGYFSYLFVLMVLRNFYIAGAVVVWVILLFFIGVIIYNGLAIQLEVRPDYFKITYLIPYKTITIAYRDIKATRNYRSDESSRGNDRRSVLTEEIETEEELISFTNLQFSNYQRLKAAIYSRTTAAKGQHQH